MSGRRVFLSLGEADGEEDGGGKDGEDEAEGDGGVDLDALEFGGGESDDVEVGRCGEEEQFHPDEAEDEDEGRFEEAELRDEGGEAEVERAEAEDGEDVAGEDHEGVRGDGEDGRNGIDGEDQVGDFDHDEGEEEWGDGPFRGEGSWSWWIGDDDASCGVGRIGGSDGAAGEEALAVEEIDGAEAFFGEADERIVAGGIVGVDEGHLGGGEDEEEAEEDEDPSVAHDEFRAEEDHAAAHDEGTDDAPEEDAVLVFIGDCEEAEDHGDHEDVVHGEGFFDDVAGEVLDGGCGSGDFAEDDGAVAVHGGIEAEAEPMIFVGEVDEAGEGDAAGEPDCGPDESFLHTDLVGVAVEDAEVEDQEDEDEEDEPAIGPDFEIGCGGIGESGEQLNHEENFMLRGEKG